LVRRDLQQQTVYDADGRVLQSLANHFLDRSEQIRDKIQVFIADRLVASAAAVKQAIDDSQRLSDASSAPSREHAGQLLQSVYFRTQQADYFFEQSNEPDAKALGEIARRWYQKALQFVDTDPGISENYAHAAEQLITALESLAQGQVSMRAKGGER
jgi:hypothetical protein